MEEPQVVNEGLLLPEMPPLPESVQSHLTPEVTEKLVAFIYDYARGATEAQDVVTRYYSELSEKYRHRAEDSEAALVIAQLKIEASSPQWNETYYPHG